MKNVLIITLFSWIVWGCQSSSQTNSPVAVTDSILKASLFPPLTEAEVKQYHDAIDDLLSQNLYQSSFNGSVLVAKNGTVLYEKYIGFQNLKLKDSIRADVSFQLASTSKPFTASAILKLVQEGKLSLNDSVVKFLPDFPYKAVTIKMLLTHRSGIPNYLNFMGRSKWPRAKFATNGDVLNSLITGKIKPAYQPNVCFNYCNTNYVILASVIEQITGISYPDYLKTNFFGPFGMTNTFVHTTYDSSNITQSYQRSGAPWTLDFSDGAYGDKNIYSTPQDLLKWDQALYAGRVLNQTLLDSAFTPYSHEKPGIHNYGLGWRMLLYPNGKKVVYHNGHWHGFNSAFARLTDEKVTIIILSNKYNNNVYTAARKLYNLFGNYDDRQDENED